MLCVEPRSSWIHCGSPKALAQRVVVALPSTARLGVVLAFSLDEEVAGLLSAMLVVPQPPVTGVLVRVGVLVGPEGVFVTVGVRVGVFVGPAGVFVRVGVLVGPAVQLVLANNCLAATLQLTPF